MRYILFILSVILFISGCSSKQYFKPDKTIDSKFKVTDISGNIVDFNNNGATLSNQKYISTSGIEKLQLSNNFKFINKVNQSLISADNNGSVAILENNQTQTFHFDKNIIAASKKDNTLALLFIDNSLVIYDTDKSKIKLKEYFKPSSLNDIKIANPIILDSIILFPTLDGKIVIIDKVKATIIKTINIDPNGEINNIIFLANVDDNLVAATSNKLFVFANGNIFVKEHEVKFVAVDQNNIYLSTLDGQIIKYDYKLNKIKSKKFKFAKFYALGVNKYLYALELNDYLIQLTKDFEDIKVYDFNFDEDEKVFILNDKLYFEDQYITLP